MIIMIISLTALFLVRTVRTVGVSVAHPRQRYALAFGLPASELVSVAHAFFCKNNIKRSCRFMRNYALISTLRR